MSRAVNGLRLKARVPLSTNVSKSCQSRPLLSPVPHVGTSEADPIVSADNRQITLVIVHGMAVSHEPIVPGESIRLRQGALM
jgi:hypothetical protein